MMKKPNKNCPECQFESGHSLECSKYKTTDWYEPKQEKEEYKNPCKPDCLEHKYHCAKCNTAVTYSPANYSSRKEDIINYCLTCLSRTPVKSGLNKGREEESIGCLEHSKVEVNKVVEEIEKEVEKLKVGRIIVLGTSSNASKINKKVSKHKTVARIKAIDEALEIIRKYKTK